MKRQAVATSDLPGSRIKVRPLFLSLSDIRDSTNSHAVGIGFWRKKVDFKPLGRSVSHNKWWKFIVIILLIKSGGGSLPVYWNCLQMYDAPEKYNVHNIPKFTQKSYMISLVISNQQRASIWPTYTMYVAFFFCYNHSSIWVLLSIQCFYQHSHASSDSRQVPHLSWDTLLWWTLFVWFSQWNPASLPDKLWNKMHTKYSDSEFQVGTSWFNTYLRTLVSSMVEPRWQWRPTSSRRGSFWIRSKRAFSAPSPMPNLLAASPVAVYGCTFWGKNQCF